MISPHPFSNKTRLKILQLQFCLKEQNKVKWWCGTDFIITEEMTNILPRCLNAEISNLRRARWKHDSAGFFLVYPFICPSIQSAADAQLTLGELCDLLVHSFLLLWLSSSACLLCFPTQPSGTNKEKALTPQYETPKAHSEDMTYI